MPVTPETSAEMALGHSRDAQSPEPLGKVPHLLPLLRLRPVRKGLTVRDPLTPQS